MSDFLKIHTSKNERNPSYQLTHKHPTRITERLPLRPFEPAQKTKHETNYQTINDCTETRRKTHHLFCLLSSHHIVPTPGKISCLTERHSPFRGARKKRRIRIHTTITVFSVSFFLFSYNIFFYIKTLHLYIIVLCYCPHKCMLFRGVIAQTSSAVAGVEIWMFQWRDRSGIRDCYVWEESTDISLRDFRCLLAWLIGTFFFEGQEVVLTTEKIFIRATQPHHDSCFWRVGSGANTHNSCS